MAVTEVATGGAQIETAFPMQLDSLHDIRLTLGNRSVVVKARIAHCRISDVEEERVSIAAASSSSSCPNTPALPSAPSSTPCREPQGSLTTEGAESAENSTAACREHTEHAG